MTERLYVEIGNICNLSCSFCPKTKRAPRRMTPREFQTVMENANGEIKYVYLHVMGEPLLHPALPEIIDIAKSFSKPVCITTNGTLLASRGREIISRASAVHKVSISLHAPEGNDIFNPDEYLSSAISFAKEAAEAGIYVVFRLWNMPSGDSQNNRNLENPKIEAALRESFAEEWQRRPRGYRLANRIFLEYDGIFVWPEESTAGSEEKFCYALSSQAAVLADGTVVPCCLDSEGRIPLGNIFESKLSDILKSERACKIREGFHRGYAVEEMCKRCSYAGRFKVRNN